MLTSLAATALIVGATTYNIAFFITMYITSFFWIVGISLLVFSVVVNSVTHRASRYLLLGSVNSTCMINFEVLVFIYFCVCTYEYSIQVQLSKLLTSAVLSLR